MEICYRFIRKKESDSIIKLWNDNIGCLFPMDEELFYQNIENDRNLLKKDIFGVFINSELAGFIIFKQQLEYRGLMEAEKIAGNINSLIVDFKYRNNGIGGSLLYKCENILQARGVKHIEVGRDTFHFFPGMPLELKDGYEFFKKRGYIDSHISTDLICNISNVDFCKLRSIKKLRINEEEGYIIEPYQEEDKEKLIQFFKKTFPGRWLGEVEFALDNGINGEDMIILKDIKKDIVIGFSRIYHKNSKIIGPPIYWRKLLGVNFGGLGPIGIDSQYRKKDLGLTLLFRSLEILKSKGIENMCIDWTDLYKFYGTFNFIPWKSYMHMGKDFN
ncbi:putative acetyltransferase [Clostridium liquoris]|jgi:predicted N-acetyltransferase YhbS|uniref:Putative acetyltransferase n=1 Tax=Clostridium liquoris TaxID=1289519 RepID=A0A2T0B6S0_9CLOT|nr:GNAT family N-acetyltransferase [Clostridium liquoris]PRR79589.1 putative acetyltransferase [Clostridium liquoris]